MCGLVGREGGGVCDEKDVENVRFWWVGRMGE